MTLIVALVNQDQTILVSDRRLTGTSQESNKAFVFTCGNARLAVAFTGLAQVGSFLVRRWIPETLMACAKPDFLMASIIERFRERASKDFAEIQVAKPSQKYISVMFAGYCYDDDPPRGYVWLVGNGPLEDGKVSDKFVAEYYREKRPTNEKPCMIISDGTDQAFKEREADIEILVRLLRENRPAKAIIDKTVEVMRASAASKKSKNLIGENYSSIILPRNPGKNAIGYYHPASATYKIFGVTTVIAVGNDSGVFTVAEPEYEFRDRSGRPILVSVPKVGRNRPCPCGSGRKYKHCHGR